MSKQPIQIITRPDDGKWSSPSAVVDLPSDYGVQFAVFGRAFIGVGVYKHDDSYEGDQLADKTLFILQKFPQFWVPLPSLPEKYKSQGRPAVAVLNGRLFIAYRGTNDGVYLIYSDDLQEWTDVGRIGSKYAKSVVAPALEVNYATEKLHLAGVGDDKYIYHTSLDYEGKRLFSWTKIDGTGTRSALAMAADDYSVYLFHTHYNNKSFLYQTLPYEEESAASTPTWSKPTQVKAPAIASGVSATAHGSDMIVSYRGTKSDVVMQTLGYSYEDDEDDRKWSGEEVVTSKKTMYQTGITSFQNVLYLSYALEKPDDSTSNSAGYNKPNVMNEKGGFVSEKQVNEWDCKWMEPKEEEKKSGFRKLFFCL